MMEGERQMICPNCKSDTLNEEKDMVVCSNCGFKASLWEYNIWKKIYKEKPQRKQEIRFHEDKEPSTETYTNTVNLSYILFALVLMILLIIIV